MTADDLHMSRTLELARAGVGLVSPNPAVGALVLDRDGNEVGAGTHIYEGMKHAEVLALEAAGQRARGGTLYVNLEPCSHQGRTAPCADAIIAAGVRRVVCAMEDPNPRVAGAGFQKLREAGISVDVGLLATESRKLNEHFAAYIRRGKPFVTLKSAMSLDGKIAPAEDHFRAASPPIRELREPKDLYQGTPSGVPQAEHEERAFRRWNEAAAREWITGEAARADVQRLRHEHDAILVGIGTILADDPLLTDRSDRPRRRPLLRVILDSHLRIPIDSRLVKTAQGDVLIVYSSAEDEKKRELKAKGVRLQQIASDSSGRIEFSELLRHLGQIEITSLLVEGGARVNATALASGEVDKLFLYFAPKLFGDGVPFACGGGGNFLRSVAELSSVQFHQFESDFAVEGYLRDPYGQ